jgi:hypothetical protein
MTEVDTLSRRSKFVVSLIFILIKIVSDSEINTKVSADLQAIANRIYLAN